MTVRNPDDDNPNADQRATLEQLIRWRRDVRRFKRDAVPDALVERLLRLADLAPSVGNSQPWRIVNVPSPELRTGIEESFEAARTRAGSGYNSDQADLYFRLKLAGLDAAPVHLAIFCDHGVLQGHGLGRHTMPET
ncbi:MAG: nitroreductase family protein, partial [Proteobacteria bacterium]|nr:nitroreductase family protein [Pseudomonadota bacterium]